MKKNNTKNKLPFFLCLLFALSVSNAYSQILWDAGGDKTSWDDAANWEMDLLPPADSAVAFNQDVTVTGTAAIGPARINIEGGATVTLDLDISVGDGVINEHTVVVASNCTLNLGANGSNRMFNFNPPANKQGIAIFGSTDSSIINIAESTTLTIEQGTNGINIASGTSSLTNNGTVNCTSGVKNGVKSSGSITNNGTFLFNELITDGIQIRGGTFENGASGLITITKPGEDCIEIIDSSFFNNFGTIDVVAKDSAGSGNNGLAIGAEMVLGTFNNAVGGIVNVNGGAKESGRAVSVNEMGVLMNMGTINFSGGGEGSRLYSRGAATNGLGGILDLTDGRVNVNDGVFTNNGLVKSTRDGSGIFVVGTATNNAFFDYTNSNNFASGSNGTITDNGINLNDATQTTIDAAGSCTVDIAEAPYQWSEGALVVATADDTGSFTFPAKSVTTDPVMLSTSIDGVVITVENFCSEALDNSTGIEELSLSQTKELLLSPSFLTSSSELTVDLSAFEQQIIGFELINLSGQTLKKYNLEGGISNTIDVGQLPAGIYLLANAHAWGRFVVVE